MARRALITGITGQDGSYLAELLLDQGYEVIGMVRRSSTVNFERIAHIQDRVTFVTGDLLDEVSMIDVLRTHRPDEVFNLAAQSFVQTSFTQPVLTGETTALGVTRLLDAIRIVDPDIRFYQASSSEMFGKVVEVPQRESTPFHPRSPYGVAKVYGHWITVNYRESYDLHATSGILFNHESVPAWTPIVVRRRGIIDIRPIGEIVPHREDPSKGKRYQSDGGGYEVWDGSAFVPCTARTAYWHDGEAVTIEGRGGVVTSTPDHVVFEPDGEREAQRFAEGDSVVIGDDPLATFATSMTRDEAWLIGLLVADGYVSERGDVRVTNGDPATLTEAGEAWTRVTGGWYRKWEGAPSAFSPKRTPVAELRGNTHYGRLLRHELYGRDGTKRVPTRVLNAGETARIAFLEGYNLGDGLKAGHGTDPFKSFRTTSPTLAAGLVWLARRTLERRVTVYRQPGALGGGASWLLNLSTGSPQGNKGAHLRKPLDEVRRVTSEPFSGWMFDIETTSGRFCAGVGGLVVHNSPRRGLEFVTRKISWHAAQISLGMATELRLGNLEAQRDWGFAGDYVKAMWLMLQQDEPGDYVVSTNETHTVREFCELAFERVGLDWEKHVVIDEAFFRPAEVDLLVGDSAKARTILGWEPEVDFESLVHMMVDADVALLSGRLQGLK
ncbi:MAG: GDP-mannose 4,6-dehydratase [Acidimicrobiales bacterium]